MRTFIIFLAFSLLLSFTIVAVSEEDNYILAQIHLKALAEDCAEAGALALDSSGTIPEDKAKERAAEVLNAWCSCENGVFSNKEELEASFESQGSRGYKATITYTPSKGFFRLIKNGPKSITRSSVYAWE